VATTSGQLSTGVCGPLTRRGILTAKGSALRRSVGQDVAVESGTLRFEVEKARIGWGAYLRDLMRPKFGGGFESYSGSGPSVVAENAKGEKRVIAVYKKVQDAKDGAVVIEGDFNRLGVAAWCDRYDVPPSFVSG
jgi:hypothetical protein